jgi:hypothetical protein
MITKGISKLHDRRSAGSKNAGITAGIALFLTNQIEGSARDYKTNVINKIINTLYGGHFDFDCFFNALLLLDA